MHFSVLKTFLFNCNLLLKHYQLISYYNVMIIVKTAISVSCNRQQKKLRKNPSDRLSSIKTINLMNLKRIKGKNACGADRKQQKEMKLFVWRALRFQLIRNYVILIDLIRLTSYLTLIFRRPNYTFNIFLLFLFSSCCVTFRRHLENYHSA